MQIIEINGWLPGFKKVSCTKALQLHAGLGLLEAKQITDAVLDGKQQLIEMQSTLEGTTLVATLLELGALARVVPAT
jgi:ribosomal protein L7/L12